MIKLITYRPEEYQELSSNIELSSPKEFMEWFDGYKEPIQLDTETNIIEGMFAWQGHLKPGTKSFVLDLDEEGNRIPALRECYVVQIGDNKGYNQWIFDYPDNHPEGKKVLLEVFKSSNEKIIHNALFDYTVIKWCFDVNINQIMDTYLMTEILHTGYEIGLDVARGYNSLAGLLDKYKGIKLSKEAQTTFDGNPMSVEQIEYAALDVKYLGEIRDILYEQIELEGLQNVMRLENSVVRVCGNSMCDNLYLDASEWQVNIDYNRETVIRSEKEFHALMIKYFNKECRDMGFINPFGEYLFNWRSPLQKLSTVKYLYPMYDGGKKVSDYKDFLNRVEDDTIEADPKYLRWLLDKDYESLETHLITRHLPFLEESGVYVPEGKIMINLNSPDQKLQLFRLIDPDLQSTGKDVISKIDHPLVRSIQEYNQASKLLSSYGQNFLDCIDPDGQFRIKGYKQILATGRMAMNQMQLLPGRKSFRNPFKPNHPETGTRDDGYKWKVIGVDYAS